MEVSQRPFKGKRAPLAEIIWRRAEPNRRWAAEASPTLASAECRLPESLHFTECDVILGVVRARSVHKIGYGHNRDWSAA